MAINVVMIRSVDFYVPFHPSTQIQHMFTFLIRDPRQLTRLSTPAHQYHHPSNAPSRLLFIRHLASLDILQSGNDENDAPSLPFNYIAVILNLHFANFLMCNCISYYYTFNIRQNRLKVIKVPTLRTPLDLHHICTLLKL